MGRSGKPKPDRRHEDFERRKRDAEYQALAQELHDEWRKRLNSGADQQADPSEGESE